MPVRDRTRIKDLQAPRRVRAYLAANAERSVLLLARSEEAAERYAKDARCFTDESVVHLPSRGVLYGDVFAPPVVRVGERQRALNSLSEARIVVAGPLGFMERTPLYEPLRLEGGANIELDDCLVRLVELGYERVDRISRHGEFTVRGGIVDIFPSTRRSPVRAEWWGDEVESVRAVSLATQRVVRELEGVAVYGAREGDLTSLAAASEEDLPEEARQGVRVPGLDRLLLGLGPVSARDLLPRGIEVWAEEPAEGLPIEEEDRDTEDIVRELYEKLPEPDLRFVTTADVGEVETVSAPPVTTPSTTIREAGRRLQSLVDEGLRVFVACSSVGEAKRTSYAFGEVGRRVEEARRVDSSLPPGLYTVPGEIEEGFSYPEGGVAVVRRDTLFGRQRARGMRTGSPSVSSFADLKSGDLVVHQVQGIGRFEGLVSKEVLGATRDYMQVSYQGGDTLFVPYEQMELLHKYVGGETARLDKLGGSSWGAGSGPGGGHRRRQGGYAEPAPDGPPGVRGRGFREDGGSGAGDLQGGLERQASHDACADYHTRPAAPQDLYGAVGTVPGQGREPQSLLDLRREEAYIEGLRRWRGGRAHRYARPARSGGKSEGPWARHRG